MRARQKLDQAAFVREALRKYSESLDVPDTRKGNSDLYISDIHTVLTTNVHVC